MAAPVKTEPARMADSSAAPSSLSKSKLIAIIVVSVVALVTIAAAIYGNSTVKDPTKISGILNSHSTSVPTNDSSVSVISTHPISSIKTTLLKHWRYSIGAAAVLLILIVVAIVLPIVIQSQTTVSPSVITEDDVELGREELEEPTSFESVDWKKILGAILVCFAVITVVIVGVEASRLVNKTTPTENNPTKTGINSSNNPKEIKSEINPWSHMPSAPASGRFFGPPVVY